MKIVINTSEKENTMIRNISRKCGEMVGYTDADEMIKCRERYGITTDVVNGTEDTTTTIIIIPDKVINAVLKIAAKVINFFGILKPIVLNFAEEMEDEIERFDELQVPVPDKDQDE